MIHPQKIEVTGVHVGGCALACTCGHSSVFFTANTWDKVFQKSVKVSSIRWLLHFVMGLKLRADLILKFIHPFKQQLPHPVIV